MISKRVAEAMRRQDWFTVLVEVVIVIVGVYIGIFLGEAASDRALQADVNRTLGFLHDQLQEDLVNLDQIVERHRTGRESYAIAIDLLSQSPVDGEAFAEASGDVALVHRSFFPNRSAYETIRQLGYLAEVRDVELQLLVANLFERIYARQTGLADSMDDAAADFMRGARDAYWDKSSHKFILEGPEGPARMRNALLSLRGYSWYYRQYLESDVRPELAMTIDALGGYLEGKE